MATALSVPSSFFLLVILSNFFIPHLATNDTTPLVFILGDSTADVGTNNHLNQSDIKANFPHNGIDFPHSRSTGRFSNGFNSADYLAKLFGLRRSPPPFLSLLTLEPHHFRKHLFKGVNFASAGSGLLDTTGSNLTVVALSEQITQLTTVRDNFTAMIGSNATEAMLSEALFFISIGSNDIFGYFANKSTMPKEKFISTLISTYSAHITTLYGLGARKFGIISVPPIGCCPSQRLVQKIITGKDDCFNSTNDFAQTFYSALDNLLHNITSQLPGIKYSLGNSFKMTMDVIANATLYEFTNVKAACCGHGDLKAQGPCNQTASLCPDRREYLFWDLFHPTKKASDLAAETLYSGTTDYVSPINFSQLPYDN
ncbi:Triacylglycerol lipase [Handroanthus impetiginosus]|uniref:Triacylglycerol lipase n=1 Tax=Handroanthus impetiginosus TaxID=429701 RepID=A0A2G9GYY9_9LAMI|nr:Triacylglycerol lipase [Handroanthus impetiginosus]